jgi:hypothetical protein
MEANSEAIDSSTPPATPQATVKIEQIDDSNAAGNWLIYKRRCEFLASAPVLSPEQAIQAKRNYALAYLGQRAQLRGGTFQVTRPTVFTEPIVAALSKRNTANRFTRYPWLAQLLSIMSALDNAQYSLIHQEGNILSFPDGYANRH